MTLPRFEVIILPDVRTEINELYDYIAFDLFSPETARKYRDGILDTINGLALTGNMFAVNDNDGLKHRYGEGVRTVRYKKFVVIYTIVDNFVVVHGIRAGKNIK